jgi:hypothetical protein
MNLLVKTLLLLVICHCFSSPLFAQSGTSNRTVKGIIIDSASHQPMSFVTVTLKEASLKTPLKSVISEKDGSFELPIAAGTKYTLTLAFVGYIDRIIPIDSGSTAIDLGHILFSHSLKQLKEVTVRAVKPLIKMEVDRIAYDVQADPDAKVLTALDMMRKVPMVTVDAEEAIKLKGNGSYKILLNGRESALLTKSPSDLLKSMPATNIQRIEIITTPPAKFDAEGLAGIINIITKTSSDQGYKIGLSTRYNTVWGTGMNINATIKQGKLGYSGIFGYSHQRQNTNTFGNTQTRFAADPSDVTVLDQSGANTHNGSYYYNQNELSYEIDSLNLISASAGIYDNPSRSDNDQLSQLFSPANSILQQYRQMNKGSNHNNGYDANLNYQMGFKRSKDQLLTLSYKYSYVPGSLNTDSRFSEQLAFGQEDFLQRNKEGLKEHTIQVDYVQPFTQVNIEAGAKAILRNNFSDFTTDTLVSPGTYNRNAPQSSAFDYQQDVYSIYNSYQLKLDKWAAKAGLRLERTDVAATFAAGNDLNTGYTNLIPSVSLQRKFENSSINLGYTQRIQRPGIATLNPFVNTSNPLFISTGNPGLKPELANSFALSYGNFKKGAVNAGLNYAFSNNSIQSVTSFKDTIVTGIHQKITNTTYRNIGSNSTLGLNVNTNLMFAQKVTLSLNGQVSKVWLEGSYNNQLYQNSGYFGSAFSSVGYKFGASGYRAGFNAGYYSGNVLLQGKSKYFITSSYSVTKEFFNKAASISLVANNPYHKYRTSTSSTNTPDFAQLSNYNQNYRNFAFRLDYKFGRLNSEIKKNQRGINNDDTGSSSKGGNT